MKRKRDAIVRRLGPVGLSLLAAGVTAVAFAAVSLAANGNGSSGSNGNGAQSQALPPPPGGGPGVMTFRDRLSAEDRQKLDDFRKCLEENGAPAPPAPPDPGKIDPSQGPPKPPSQADQDKLQKAYEACKDKLPQDMQNAGPPQLHAGGGPLCGPPPGAPGQPGQQQGQSRQGQNKQQSYQGSGAGSSGSAA